MPTWDKAHFTKTPLLVSTETGVPGVINRPGRPYAPELGLRLKDLVPTLADYENHLDVNHAQHFQGVVGQGYNR